MKRFRVSLRRSTYTEVEVEAESEDKIMDELDYDTADWNAWSDDEWQIVEWNEVDIEINKDVILAYMREMLDDDYELFTTDSGEVAIDILCEQCYQELNETEERNYPFVYIECAEEVTGENRSL